MSLTSTSASVAIPASKGNGLDHPWTLSLEILKTKETGKRGVILSCDLVELCSDLKMSDVVNAKGDKPGIGLVRALRRPHGEGRPPSVLPLSKDTSYSSQVLLPPNTWARLTAVAERGKTTFFLDGKKIGQTNNQIVCPLLRFGARTDASFVGEIRNVTLRTGREPALTPPGAIERQAQSAQPALGDMEPLATTQRSFGPSGNPPDREQTSTPLRARRESPSGCGFERTRPSAAAARAGMPPGSRRHGTNASSSAGSEQRRNRGGSAAGVRASSLP